MSGAIEDDEEGATQMMSARSLVGEATPDALDEEEGDLTVPFDRGAAFAQAVARPRPAAGKPAAPRKIDPVEPELETGSITVPVVRDDLPLPSLSEFGDTGEMTVPRGLAPKAAASELRPPAWAKAPEPRAVPRYDLPPPAYKPPPAAPQQGSRPGSVPPPAGYAQPQAPAPRPGSIPPGYIQSTGAAIHGPALAPPQAPFQAPTPPMATGPAQMPTPPALAQMPTPPPQGPMSAPVPSAPVPSAPSGKVRSPPVFIAVMVACTVLTVTGLLLLVYLKAKHFW